MLVRKTFIGVMLQAMDADPLKALHSMCTPLLLAAQPAVENEDARHCRTFVPEASPGRKKRIPNVRTQTKKGPLQGPCSKCGSVIPGKGTSSRWASDAYTGKTLCGACKAEYYREIKAKANAQKLSSDQDRGKES